ncbi:Molybdenum cofactor sulfurase [Teratosphaeria destructans]|uniref:Molybdenum cofactor sulfurase n=1 Tax=Teratosphaeria destructans TaxID=418781 RepID=A0A9W7SZX4_9PEZI|nr:Molybdenum cofactor sulfurase [Teratosphaeria destructans]
MDGVPGSLEAYDGYIQEMRREQYPMLEDALYLDHAGTTLYSKRLMERFQADMMADLFGNPHSTSPSSQRSTALVEDVRHELLRFFNADPNDFDLVFTSNATAAIKLVMEGFREQQGGFWYGYHVDSHTSLVGVRESAVQHRCFASDYEVENWVMGPSDQGQRYCLFAYPAQSNMNGRRLPLGWCERIRCNSRSGRVYTLLDAAAYASTTPLNLDDVAAADFTAVSLNKIFGFPDLGALILRKSSAHIFDRRNYFGGGTVDMVVSLREQWHAAKCGPPHERLEDGTLPIHSLLALRSAIRVHNELCGSQHQVARHTADLTTRLYRGLSSLRHGNGEPVCVVYKSPSAIIGDSLAQGPILAFNLKDRKGSWVSNVEIERLVHVKNISIRIGGVCNPGGITQALDLEPWEMRENFSAGHRCGGENGIMNGKPTGVLRASLGAMSTRSDVTRFVEFIEEFFVDRHSDIPEPSSPKLVDRDVSQRFYVERLMVYPIKSCAGWRVPEGIPWDVRKEGLMWDREWCIVHQGTRKALSQKQHPRMALIVPILDFKKGILKITAPNIGESISVPLSKDPTCFYATEPAARDASVCGDQINARFYSSAALAHFLTEALGVPCTLARYPAVSAGSPPARHSKAHLPQSQGQIREPQIPLLLSNESPILTISRSSLNRLNEHIKAKGGKAAHPSVFRANIVLAENPWLPPGQEQPWAEDRWRGMRIGGDTGVPMDFLGGCRRCQMVCIDQRSGEKNQEPFLTLAKTRRFEGGVLFGIHTSLACDASPPADQRIKVGDAVETFA